MSVSAGEGLVCKCVHGHGHTAFVREHLSICWCCPLTTPSFLSLFPGTTMRQAAPVLAQSEGPNSGRQTSGEQSCGRRSVYLGGQKGEQGPAVHLAAKGEQQNLNWVNRDRASRPREVIIPFSSELIRLQFFTFFYTSEATQFPPHRHYWYHSSSQNPITFASPCNSSLEFSHLSTQALQVTPGIQDLSKPPRNPKAPRTPYCTLSTPPSTCPNPGASRTLFPQDPLCTPRSLSVLRHTHTPLCPVNTGTQSPGAQHHPPRTSRSLLSCSPPVPCEKHLDVWVPDQKQQDPDRKFRKHFYSTQVWGEIGGFPAPSEGLRQRGLSIPGGTVLQCGKSLCSTGSLQSRSCTLRVKGCWKPQEEPTLGEGSGHFCPLEVPMDATWVSQYGMQSF